MRFSNLTSTSSLISAVIAAVAGWVAFGTLPLTVAAVVAVFAYQMAQSWSVPGDNAVSALLNTIGVYWVVTAAAFIVSAVGLAAVGTTVGWVLVVGGVATLAWQLVSGLLNAARSS